MSNFPLVLDPKDINETFGKPGWFDVVRAEVEACTSGVAVADISPTLKMEISVSKFVDQDEVL
jgi:glycine cleavage system aminomethyltransferase T